MPPAAAAPASYASTIRYENRAGKARYIADKYRPVLTGSVLDVGCDEAPLRAFLPRPDLYVGVDLRPSSDVVLDLDRENLPFPARSFDAVVCTDVLEHLERCHRVFDECCRASRRHVLVSLPNPLRNLLLALAAGGTSLKFYGLPVDPPSDRHRWFFGHDEAAEFLRVRGLRAGFEIEQIDTEEGGCPSWRDASGRDRLAAPHFRAGTLWCLLRRAHP